MKRVIIGHILLLLAVNAFSQGIQFEEGLNWEEIKKKAVSENKFIFLDCYATWCGPCKMMDKMIYPTEKAGTAMKDRFLSVKVQFDTTKDDNEEVKQWHEAARSLNEMYKIVGFPTYLFFSPEGKLVYQALGFKDPDAFVTMVNYAMTDPKRKFDNELAEYKSGKRNYPKMLQLIEMTRESGDNEFVALMLKDYKTNYLDKLNQDSLLTKERIGFLLNNYNLVTSKDNFFKLMYSQPSAIDSIWGEPIAHTLINFTINKEEIEDKLWKNDQPVNLKPDWQKLEATISKKYKKIDAKTMVAEARFNFYKKAGDWKKFARLKDQAIKQTPPKAIQGVNFQDTDSWKLNSDAWDVFKFCMDKEPLTRALSWSELSIKLDDADNPNVQLLDTRANLLYKLGRVEEAIAQEEKAIEIAIAQAKKAGKIDGGFFAKNYAKIVEKMKAGEPTWKVK